jgi:hypothetical protein
MSTKPSINDYLSEICKEDDVDLNEYLSSENATKTIEVRDSYFRTNALSESLFNPKMTYDWKDRVKSVWIQIKSLRYTSYNILDFKSYDTIDRPFEFFCYTKVSTPWDRFKRFVRTQIKELKWSWNFTPEHIKHYNENKPRINGFEDIMDDLFFLEWDGKKNKIIKELKENGYRVEDNRIWHEPIPLDEDKRII